MNTTGFVHRKVRKVAYAVMRRFPKLRLKFRYYYWGRQRKRFEQLTAINEPNPKMVVFGAFGGKSYACSPRAIYETMLQDPRFDDYELVWAFKRETRVEVQRENPMLKRAKIVKRGTPEYFNAVSSAGTIIINNRLPEYIYPGPGQTFVQCWHGTPLKRLGYDVTSNMHAALNTASELADRYRIDREKWTYLLSPSPYASEHLADAFGLPVSKRASTIIEEGYPRNDALVRHRDDHEYREQLRRDFGVPQGKKVLLYAPTWRDDSYVTGVGYTFDYLLDFDKMRAALGDEWVVLFRPHYFVANAFDFSAYEGFVIDASKVDDINELYLASHMLMTDYSSVMFDYANLREPIILYVPDLDHYAGDIRGFYFDINKVPGPKCKTTDEVIACMQDEGCMEQYAEAYEEYVQTFCPKDDGHAAERVIERVFFS